jgi:hypothetical protein
MHMPKKSKLGTEDKILGVHSFLVWQSGSHNVCLPRMAFGHFPGNPDSREVQKKLVTLSCQSTHYTVIVTMLILKGFE